MTVLTSFDLSLYRKSKYSGALLSSIQLVTRKIYAHWALGLGSIAPRSHEQRKSRLRFHQFWLIHQRLRERGAVGHCPPNSCEDAGHESWEDCGPANAVPNSNRKIDLIIWQFARYRFAWFRWSFAGIFLFLRVLPFLGLHCFARLPSF